MVQMRYWVFAAIGAGIGSAYRPRSLQGKGMFMIAYLDEPDPPVWEYVNGALFFAGFCTASTGMIITSVPVALLGVGLMVVGWLWFYREEADISE